MKTKFKEGMIIYAPAFPGNVQLCIKSGNKLKMFKISCNANLSCTVGKVYTLMSIYSTLNETVWKVL